MSSDAQGAQPGPVEFGRTAEDYRRHRKGYPRRIFDRLASMGVGHPGQLVVDIGTGTGHLARGLAARGAQVTGVDPSEALMREARILDAEAGVSVAYKVGRAEATGLPPSSADAVAGAQCWHWFDRPAAREEALRILRPGGRLAILHFDWLPLPGSVVEATEALILAHNPSWALGGGDGLYPHYEQELALSGFRGIEVAVEDVGVRYTHEGWRGRIRASAGVGAALSPARVARFDEELEALLRDRFPEAELEILHRLFCLVCERP